MIVNKVVLCDVNTSKLPLLSEKKQKELLLKIKDGDKNAREEFINGNLRLVLSVLQRFNNRGENADDLFQVGCIGLIKSIDNFDISVGVKFSTYAVPMILGELRRYLRDYNPIRVSRSVKDLAYKALQAKEEYIRKNNKEPKIEEIAKILECDPKDVSNAFDAILDPVSLFEPVFHDGTDTLFVMDQVSDVKNTDDSWIESIALKEAISKLNAREKNIVNLRFFQGKTQMEVAKEIGISQAQVSRLEKNAISHIKKMV